MTTTNRYYEEELSYLLEAGREYARLHPERARRLGLEDRDAQHRDPHVERLVEAFAFLTGRIREKIEDEFPELSHSLLKLLWPHYLRPVPSMALLEFTPLPGMLREPQRVPAGFLVDSRPTAEGVSCRFRTAYPVDLQPLRLVDAGVDLDEAGRRSLRLSFELLEGAEPSRMRIERLRLHLSGEGPDAFQAYRLLRHSVESVTLAGASGPFRTLPPGAVRAVGFAPQDELLTYPEISFPGYRLLAEYFVFRRKFLFVDFVGLGALDLGAESRTFDLRVSFDSRPPDSFRPKADSFRLHVTPIINLFPRQGEPVRVTHLRSSYPVLADYAKAHAYEVVSVDEVTGVPRGEVEARRHRPFYSFGQEVGESGISYDVRHGRTESGRWTTEIALVSRRPGELPKEETLSLALTCSNGALPHEGVGLGEIDRPGGERLDVATFRNITRPTRPIYPRLGEGAEWRFVSHMALSHVSLADAANLRRLLQLYDVGDRPENRRRIGAVKSLVSKPREILLGGAPVRGTALEMTIDETCFDDEGDLLIFSEVLSQFFSLYAGVNSFTELTVHREPSGEVLRCPAVAGIQTEI